jgi:hypothetical protein
METRPKLKTPRAITRVAAIKNRLSGAGERGYGADPMGLAFSILVRTTPHYWSTAPRKTPKSKERISEMSDSALKVRSQELSATLKRIIADQSGEVIERG